MRAVRSVSWMCLAAMLALLAACSGPQPAQKAASSAVVPSASAAAASPANAPAEYVASGPIVVENQLDVQSLREGVVARIRADVGAKVRKGDLLAQLDDRQIAADRDAEAAKVKSIAADVQSWTYDTKALQSDLDRAEAMYKENLITKEMLDHARYKEEEDTFEVEREKQDLANAQDMLQSLNLELEKTRIVAPFDGVVARRYVREGQKVAVGDRLFWVTAVAPLRVNFTLPERFAGRVQAGQQLAVTVPDRADTLRARVISVSPVVDPASGTIEVVSELEKPPSDLRPGMTTSIHLPEPR